MSTTGPSRDAELHDVPCTGYAFGYAQWWLDSTARNDLTNVILTYQEPTIARCDLLVIHRARNVVNLVPGAPAPAPLVPRCFCGDEAVAVAEPVHGIGMC